MRLDFRTVDEIEDLRAVPEGEYRCRISEVRVSRSPAGHTRWGMRWEVSAGDFQGRTACWDSLHWTERGLPRAKFVLRILGFNVTGPLEVEASDLQGREALVQCIPEERDDPITGARRIVNRVPFAGYRALAPSNGNGKTAAPEGGGTPAEQARAQGGSLAVAARSPGGGSSP